MIKQWEIEMILHSAYRHGKAYRDGNIYRSCGKWCFKRPEVTGLPHYVIDLSIEDHQFLSNIYRHAFRCGLNSKRDMVGAI